MRGQVYVKYFMGQPLIHLTVLICCVTLYGVLGIMENLASAASASEKAEVKRSPIPVATRHSVTPLTTRKGHISGPGTGTASKNKKLSDRQVRKALRGRKHMPPETGAKSMPGLAHHDLLKASHRYHLHQGDRESVVVTPHPGDLMRDHFLELDKNRDGVIDPLERAIGRLDIERDMNNR